MSEEEILEKIEKIIKHFESQEYILNGQKIYDYLQGLLDLYNKEKEKNASLQKEIKLMKSININDNYISKDKIKAKTKELEVMLRTYIENSKNDIYYNREYVNSIEMSIKTLEELLEE